MRRYQRGLGVIGYLIGAAVVGALLVGATIWVNHFIDTTWVDPAEKRGELRGIDKQLALDAPILEQVKAERDDAKSRLAHAQEDTAACVAAVNTQSDQVRRWKAEADRRIAESAKAKADNQAAHAVAQTAIQRYQEIAARPPIKDETCEAQLGKVDKLLRDAARARAAAKAAPK